MQSTSASTMMQLADRLSFSSRNYHWNSIKLRKIVRVMTSCRTPPACSSFVLISRIYATILHIGAVTKRSIAAVPKR